MTDEKPDLMTLPGEDTGDAAQDEVAMDAAPAVVIVRADEPDLAVCRVKQWITCSMCDRPLSKGELFSAELALGPCHEHAVCSRCRAFRVRVEVAG